MIRTLRKCSIFSNPCTGSVYIRWGRTSCPSTAALIYSGSVAGSYFNHKGSGADPLCLPDQPIYGRYADHKWGGILYGAEYQYATNAPYSSSFQNKDVPCSMCMTTGRQEVFMLPARNECPKGWVREYHGYLMSEHYSNSYRSQHLCFDDNIEAIEGRDSATNGIHFFPVSVDCGYGIACPPYVDARELTCSVCSKREIAALSLNVTFNSFSLLWVLPKLSIRADFCWR